MSEQEEPSIAADYFAGADWVEKSLGRTLSPIGRKAANVLGFVYAGIYHLDQAALKKVNWADKWNVHVIIDGSLATYDANALTRLVIAAHDLCARVEIEARAYRYLRLTFSERERNGRSVITSHPTIEQAIESARRRPQS